MMAHASLWLLVLLKLLPLVEAITDTRQNSTEVKDGIP